MPKNRQQKQNYKWDYVQQTFSAQHRKQSRVKKARYKLNKIFTNHISNERLISKGDEELLQFNKVKRSC